MLLSMVRYQVLLCFRHTDTDGIAINKLCKLNLRYFTMYLTSMVMRTFLNMLFTFLETLVY